MYALLVTTIIFVCTVWTYKHQPGQFAYMPRNILIKRRVTTTHAHCSDRDLHFIYWLRNPPRSQISLGRIWKSSIEEYGQPKNKGGLGVWRGVTTPNPSEVIFGLREQEKMVVLVDPSADKQDLPRFRPPKVKALCPACLVLIDEVYRRNTMARSGHAISLGLRWWVWTCPLAGGPPSP